eukprot:TRINITY_DN9675_c0_g1_i2.p1 TRINITY_DN9675_c0_g1~~TRINITY_DN9675_c0_g1_i2.p1  ORF type:complete len:454 (-),score=77.46 TRINITY_DN9675_c0_g1_i2:196-1557(-)
MWELLHTLAVSAPAGKWRASWEVIRGTVLHLFACRGCQTRFAVATGDLHLGSRDELVLWLWWYHNEVTVQVWSWTGSDRAALLWPPKESCPKCRGAPRPDVESGSAWEKAAGLEGWDTREVLAVMERVYAGAPAPPDRDSAYRECKRMKRCTSENNRFDGLSGRNPPGFETGFCMQDGRCRCLEGYSGEGCKQAHTASAQDEPAARGPAPSSAKERCIQEGRCAVEKQGTTKKWRGQCDQDGECLCFAGRAGKRCEKTRAVQGNRGWYFGSLREECLHEERCVHTRSHDHEAEGKGDGPGLAREEWNGRCDDKGLCRCYSGYEGEFCGVMTVHKADKATVDKTTGSKPLAVTADKHHPHPHPHPHPHNTKTKPQPHHQTVWRSIDPLQPPHRFAKLLCWALLVSILTVSVVLGVRWGWRRWRAEGVVHPYVEYHKVPGHAQADIWSREPDLKF